MGQYFSNFHIRSKKISIITEEIINYYTNLGMKITDANSADVIVSLYQEESSEWISVYSQDFIYKDVLDVVPVISEKHNVDALAISCIDSDYLFLNLINMSQAIDLWLNIGRSNELKIKRKSNINGWKSKIKDFKLFKENAKKEYICAEEFLKLSNEYFDLPYEQIIPSDKKDCYKLYFSKSDKKDISGTKLELTSYSLSPIKANQPILCKVNNIGKASNGLAIVFSGNYIEHDEIYIEDVNIILSDKEDTYKYLPITLEKAKLETGEYVYYWKNNEFKISKVISEDLPAQIYNKKRNIESIGLRFVPRGNERKMLDIKLTFIPLSNPINGQCTWYVWMGHESKKEYIKKYNEGAKKHNDSFGTHFEIIDDEYDID